jgi:hypothetical protein
VAGVTVKDVLAAQTAEAHMRAVEGWAQAVWGSWEQHHATVREWLMQI